VWSGRTSSTKIQPESLCKIWCQPAVVRTSTSSRQSSVLSLYDSSSSSDCCCCSCCCGATTPRPTSHMMREEKSPRNGPRGPGRALISNEEARAENEEAAAAAATELDDAVRSVRGICRCRRQWRRSGAAAKHLRRSLLHPWAGFKSHSARDHR
jgi:hypothetical protein